MRAGSTSYENSFEPGILIGSEGEINESRVWIEGKVYEKNLMTKIYVSASIACASPLCYGDTVVQLDRAGLDAYHFDICDGHFAPTFLLAPSLIRALRPLTNRRFDVHLYCTHPSRYLDELAACGADLVVVHIESQEDYPELIRQIRVRGLKAGIAVLPDSTMPQDIANFLSEVSLVIANTVGPAYAGQPFDKRGLQNMAQLSRIVRENNLDIEIGADGNVGVERLPDLFGAGCTHLVCGTSSVFKPDVEPGQALMTFQTEVALQSSREANRER